MSNATRGWERTFGGHILVGCKNDLLLCEVSESAYRPDLIGLPNSAIPALGWSTGQESDLHELSPTGLSSRRVCQIPPPVVVGAIATG